MKSRKGFFTTNLKVRDGTFVSTNFEKKLVTCIKTLTIMLLSGTFSWRVRIELQSEEVRIKASFHIPIAICYRDEILLCPSNMGIFPRTFFLQTDFHLHTNHQTSQRHEAFKKRPHNVPLSIRLPPPAEHGICSKTF